MEPERRPLLALACGDPAGIGPEVSIAAARDERVRAAARLVLVGPEGLRPADFPRCEPSVERELCWLASPIAGAWETGRASAAGGRAASNAAGAPEAMTDSRPSAAFAAPPEIGASR